MYTLEVIFRICVLLGITIVCGKDKHCNTSLLLQVYGVSCGMKILAADMGQECTAVSSFKNNLYQKHLKL